MRIPALLLTMSTVACSFDADLPREGFFVCDGDDQCPAGLVCNEAQARCVEADADVLPPTLLGYAFGAPVVAAGTSEFTITADEPLAADGATVDASSALQAALTPLGADRETFRFLVNVDALDEGAYAVAGVTALDVAGNVAALRQSNVVLVVDRTPPVVFELARFDEPVGGYSDVANHVDDNGTATDRFTVRFTANELLQAATLEFGTANAACVVLDETRPRLECSVDLAVAEVADGTNGARLTVVDLAGNASVRVDDVVVDAAAPSLVPGSVFLDLAGPGTTGATEAAVEGGRLRLRFLADEPVAAARVFLTPTNDAFDVIVNGTSVDALLTLRTGLGATTLGARAELVDRFGHVRSLAVALPSPYDTGIPVAASVVTPCPLPGVVCVDADGDGAFAVGGCATGTDCNDLDPTVFPGAIELPGDGVANDCGAGADLPIDEATGVFIDADAGDDATGDGSRAAPVRSLFRAAGIQDRAPGRRFLYVAASASELDANTLRTEFDRIDGIVGGLDPTAGWTRRAGTTSAFASASGGIVLPDNAFLDGVSLRSAVTTSDAVIARSRFEVVGQGLFSISFGGDVILFRNDIDAQIRLAEGATVAVVENRLGGLNARFPPRSRVVVVRTTVEKTAFAFDSEPWMQCVGCDLTIVSSFIATDPALEISSGSRVALHHSSVVAPFDVPTGATFVASGSLFETAGGGAFFRIPPDAGPLDVRLGSNGFLRRLAPIATTFVSRGTESLSLADFASLPGVVSDDNRDIPAVPFEESFCPAATSSARDARLAPFPDAATAAVLDRFGDCRYADGSADIGADELTVGSDCVVP